MYKKTSECWAWSFNRESLRVVVHSSHFDQTRTSFIKGSKEYKAGFLPAASSMVWMMSCSNKILVNRAAVGAGMPLLEVNLLFLNTGLVNK